MTVIGLIVLFLVWGLVVWLARGYLLPPFKTPVIIIATILLIIVLLSQFGFLGSLYTPLRVR